MSVGVETGSRLSLAPAGAGLTSRVRRPRSRWRLATLTLAFGAVITPYLIALASPLRLSQDSVIYLALADRIPLPPGHQAYPPGYPGLLRVAEHLGLGNGPGLVAVNLLLLAVALGAVYRLCRQPLGLTPTKAALVCLAVLLARPVIGGTPTPVSEIPYFAAAMLCLLALTAAERRSGWPRARFLVLGGVLAAAGTSVRIEGVALVPPVLLVAIGAPNLIALWRVARRHKVAALLIAAASLLVLIAVGVLFVRSTSYSYNVASAWRASGLGPFLARVGTEARTKLLSLGNLGSNEACCGGQIPTAFTPVFVAGGVAVATLVVLGWMTRRRLGAIEAFVLSTATVILVYAGAIPRFWIAAFPFMVVYALFGAERLARLRLVRVALIAYALGFAVAGAPLLIRSVTTSTSGRQFPIHWAGSVPPRMAATYRVAFGEALPGDGLKANPVMLELLRRHEPLARPSGGSG